MIVPVALAKAAAATTVGLQHACSTATPTLGSSGLFGGALAVVLALYSSAHAGGMASSPAAMMTLPAAVTASTNHHHHPTMTTTTTTILNSVLFLSGGGTGSGGAHSDSLDLTRFRLRLDGIHTYSVITSLLMNGSLRLFSSTPKRFEQGKRLQNIIKVCFSIATTLSVLASSYTTIVFSLLGLYTKRALGRGNMDDACRQFFDQTLPIREVAYDTCLLSLVTFQIAFCLSVYLNHDVGMDWKLGLAAAVAAVACWWHWSTILTLATVLFQFGRDM